MKRLTSLPTLFPSTLAAFLFLLSSSAAFARADRTLAGGWVHGAAISEGRLFTMGKNDNGALGIGSDTNYVTTPVFVSAGWRHVSASGHSTFGIKTDSTLWAWGRGNSGELGQGGTAHSNTPLQVGSSKWITVSADNMGYSILAIRSDSTLWGWGRNNTGQLGDSTTQPRLAPVQIGTAKWLEVDAGEYHSLGIQADSTLWAWGDNTSGDLGDGTTSHNTAPVQIGAAKWRAVSAAGSSHSHGIRSDGTLWSWGKNANYTLGFTDDLGYSALVPTQVGTDLWLYVDAHSKYVGAIRSDSTLWFWGNNSYNAAFGMMGAGGASAYEPLQMGTPKWSEVALGSQNQTSFGRTATGLYYSWGHSEDGQTGRGEGNFDTPQIFIKGSQTITFPALASKTFNDSDFAPGAAASSGLDVSYSSSDASVATIVSGKIHLVGAGTATITASQAGDETFDSAASVARTLTVDKASQTVTFTSGSALTYGEALSLTVAALPGSGEVIFIVDDPDKAFLSGNSLTAISGTGSVTVTAMVSADANYEAANASQAITLQKADQEALVLDPIADMTLGDGPITLNAYGGNGTGAVSFSADDGDVGSIAGNELTPLAPGTLVVTATKAADANYTAAIASDTLMVSKAGQTITFAALPAKTWIAADFSPGASASSGLTVTYTSSDNAVATIVSGNIRLAGSGIAVITASQAGNENYDSAASVSRTLTVTDPPHPHQDQKVAGYGYGSIVIRDGFGMYGSGYNGYYDLGLGDNTSRNRFHLIAQGGWRHVEGGDMSTLAIKEDSTLWGWGYNPYGFGDGETSHATPAQIGTSRWIAVSVGPSSGAILGIQADSTLWSWGDPGEHMFGDGTTSPRSIPVQVGSAKWLDVSHTQAHVLAIKADHTLWAWGTAENGRLGNGAASGVVTAPTQVGSDRWSMVSAGFASSVGIRSDGTLWSWGDNAFAQTGLGTSSGNTLAPTRVGDSSARWIWVERTYAGGAAVKSDSTLWTWGSNYQGRIAQGSATTVLAPTQVGTAKWRQAGMGSGHGIGLGESGEFHSWGANGDGQLGDGGNTMRNTPVPTVFNRIQTLAFPAFAAKTYGDTDFAPGASTNAGTAITYTSSDTTVAAIVSGQVHIAGAGTTSITASAAGNVAYDARDSSQTLTVAKAGQTIAFAPPAAKSVTDADFAPGAAASSGLAVSYASSDTTVATVVSGQIHIVGAGLTTITASQTGNADYDAAPDSSHTLTVSKLPQTITFASLDARTFGESAFALGATAASGLDVAYTSSDTTVAAVSGSTVTLVGAGSAVLTARQDGNATYDSAVGVDRTLIVNKASQTLAFDALPVKTLGDADFVPGATATSGLAVSYVSSDTAVAVIVSGQIRLVGAGTATITASQAGNGNYNAASDSSHTLTVGKAAQSITFNSLATRTFGDPPFTLAASAGSGLTVSYASSDTSVATVSGSTVTVVGAGTTDITASQAGNGVFHAAAPVAQTLSVDKADQTITFPTLAPKTLGDADFAPGATASSGLAVAYASSDTTVATIISGQIHLVGSGTATITASQTGTGDYAAAPDASQTLSVGKTAQSITFASLASRTFGESAFALGGAASSGLAVSYSSSNPAVATVSGSTVTLIGAGTADITATQGGDSTYLAAADIVRTLTVNKATQTISFASLPAKTLGDADFAPGATATSGLAVSYASSDTAVAVIVSGQIRLVGTGTATITASQAGNGNYNAASDSSLTLNVGKVAQSITFNSLATKTFGDPPFTLAASTGSGLTVSYASSDTSVATVSGSTVTIVGAGTADITATQAGDSTYLAAAALVQALTVNKANQNITFSAFAPKTLGDADFSPGASATSGLAISYASSDTTVAKVSGSTVALVGAGTATITASQAGNGNYAAAADVAHSLAVDKTPQSIAFDSLPARTFGDSAFAPAASASSGLPVFYASSDPEVATVAAGRIHIVGSGTTTVTASQAGDAAHHPAPEVARTLTVAKAFHTLTFTLGMDTLKTVGDAAFRLAALSNVGLSAAYTSSDTSVARVDGDSVRVGKAGTAELTAHQAGNNRYAAAPAVTRTLRVRIAAPGPLPLESLTPRAETAADTQVVLAWPRQAGAEGYQVQAILDPAGSTLVDRSIQDTSLPLDGLPFAAQVRWRVAPFNSTGQAPHSPYAAFQVRPAPPKPLDIARIPTYSEAGTGTTVELTWPKADLATGYRIQVFLDTTQAPRIDTTVTAAAITLKDLAPGSAQIWRVAPVNGPSQATFTPWLTFRVKDKDDGAVTKGVMVDSARPVQVSTIVAVAPNDNQTGDVTLTLTEEKRAPANLPAGFQALTGSISLSASQGAGSLNDNQITITLSPPDTALDGSPVGGSDRPLVYTIDSATGRLEVVYDLPRDSAGRIVLPLSKGKSFLLAVDTVPPVVKDGSSPEPRAAGTGGLVISGVVEDNIRNSRTMVRFRRGGSDTFDSLPMAIDGEGRFELPLDLSLDSTGFEYSITATDGRNIKATPSANVPVEVAAIKAADSLPSMQWRLFALPTLPKETRWEDLAPALGTYGPDWKLFTRAAGGLKEFGPELEKAEAGVAYWLKSRKSGLRPSLTGGIVAPINKPFEVVVPPKSWLSFGNPFLFPVSWESVLASTMAAPGALAGPYTFRDTAWISPLEIPILLPWEGYYAYNASGDTLRLRIPARKAKDVQPAFAKAAFLLQWQVRGADGKDAGNLFGGLPQSDQGPAAKTSAASSGPVPAYRSGIWHAPKPESPEGGLRAGFVSDEGGDGLLQTDFRAVGSQGGHAWSARVSGLKTGHAYANHIQGFESLPAGMAVALADAATGQFVPWSAGMNYVVEAQAGETHRELTFYAGSPEYVQSRGAEFKAAHPFAMELGNRPNPVRTYTVIDFAVPASVKGRRNITLTLVDMQGRLVKRLVSGPMATGRHSLRWDLGDERGRTVAAGSYRLLMEMGGRRMHRQLQVLP